MSIFGPVVSMLQPYGASGKTIGMLFRRIMIPLTFDLQVAGPNATDLDDDVPQSCQDANAGIQIIAYVIDNLGNAIDISGASAMTLRFRKPDGTTMEKTASFLTNGMDGGVVYASEEDDFNQDGPWDVQAAFTVAGDKKTTRWGHFNVDPNIE